jgi:hypothetical protein
MNPKMTRVAGWLGLEDRPQQRDFADMFSNWVHRSFTSDASGQARYSFMQDHMSNWINLAVTNNG